VRKDKILQTEKRMKDAAKNVVMFQSRVEERTESKGDRYTSLSFFLFTHNQKTKSQTDREQVRRVRQAGCGKPHNFYFFVPVWWHFPPSSSHVLTQTKKNRVERAREVAVSPSLFCSLIQLFLHALLFFFQLPTVPWPHPSVVSLFCTPHARLFPQTQDFEFCAKLFPAAAKERNHH